MDKEKLIDLLNFFIDNYIDMYGVRNCIRLLKDYGLSKTDLENLLFDIDDINDIWEEDEEDEEEEWAY